MTKHIVRRLIQAVPTLFGITLISFLVMSAAPGGFAAIFAFQNVGSGASGTKATGAEAVQRELERLGLDDPWPIQYLRWLVGDDWMWWKNVDRDGDGEIDQRFYNYGVLRGDFGNSYSKKRDSLELVVERFPATLELGIASLVVALALGVSIGILAAITRGRLFDNITRVLAVILNAVPNFWMGLLLLLVFSFSLNLLPSGGRCDTKYSRTGCPAVYERMEHMILPVLVLSFGGIAGFSRYMRTSMLDTINSDYVRTARAKGLPARAVWMRHAARNALIPIATFLGPAIVGVLGGAAITEQIFTWPGLGRLFLEAVNGRDYPIIMTGVVIFSTLTIIGYILSDILYAVFDPRIRF